MELRQRNVEEVRVKLLIDDPIGRYICNERLIQQLRREIKQLERQNKEFMQSNNEEGLERLFNLFKKMEGYFFGYNYSKEQE